MTVITSCVCLSGTLQFFSLDEKNWHNLMGYRSFLNASLHIARETDLLFSLFLSLALSLSLSLPLSFPTKKVCVAKEKCAFLAFLAFLKG
jgi:hypothetical protein